MPPRDRGCLKRRGFHKDRSRCYLADDPGRVHRYDEDGPTRGRPGAPRHDERWVWVMQLSPDEGSIDFVNSAARRDGLYESDIATGTTDRIALLKNVSPNLAGRSRHAGHDSWDADGRFHFTSFPWKAETDLLVTRIDPELLKKALETPQEGAAERASARCIDCRWLPANRRCGS